MEANRRKILTALTIFVGFVVLAGVMLVNSPEPELKSKIVAPTLLVETETVLPREYQFHIGSFGTVQPRTQSLLVAQVSGQITEVNPAFRDGGFFSRGDILIRIDERDYLSSVKVARANLLEAQLALDEEKAQANQAKKDWIRLGNGEDAPDLVLRKPQLAAAEAKVLSARASLEKAELDLDRTRVQAPYDGRILSTKVDLGQYVNNNASLAEIFATDVVEIRLPLKNTDLNFVDLPENYRGKPVTEDQYPHAIISSNLGEPQVWDARIVRTEAALDSSSHQLYIVAQIQDPFAVHNSDKAPLKIGQYVNAVIDGKTKQNALVIPSRSVYQGSYVYVLENSLLHRREVRLAFQSSSESVVESGLDSGAELVVSPLGQVASGTRARSNSQQTVHTQTTEELAQP